MNGMIRIFIDGKWSGIIDQDTPEIRNWWADRAHHDGFRLKIV